MFNKNNIPKLKLIVAYLGLGHTKEVKDFVSNLETQPPSDNLSVEYTLKMLEALIYDRAFDLISNDIICTDTYGYAFFTIVEEMEFQHIKALMLTKGFYSESMPINTLSRTQKFFNIPEALIQSSTTSLTTEEPLDLSKTGPFGFSIKA